MPPKSPKMVAYHRKKLPIWRAIEESPPSPSPPARKRRAATTPEARARKLQKEGLLPSSPKVISTKQPLEGYASKKVAVKRPTLPPSSSSSSLPEDPMATTTSESSSTDTSSPLNEENILDKVDKMADQAAQMEDIAQRRDAFWEARTKKGNEQLVSDQRQKVDHPDLLHGVHVVEVEPEESEDRTDHDNLP